ncbi:MAG: hypothetical protein ACK5MK_09455 [Dysgonomonas sp.]
MDSIISYRVDNQSEKEISRFILCFLLYSTTLCILLFLLPASILKVTIFVPSLIGFTWYFGKLVSFQNITSLYLKYTFILYLIWTAYIILSGITVDYDNVSNYLFSPYLFLQYLVPLIVLLPVASAPFLRQLIYFSEKLVILFILLIPIFYILGYYKNQDISEMYVWSFVPGAGFLILTSYFHDKKTIVLSIIAIILGLIIITLLARRNIMLTFGGYFFAAFCIYIIYNKRVPFGAKMTVLLLSTFLFIGGIFVFVNNQEGYFSKITERATEDTRGEVLVYYYADMNEDNKNWIMGKGLNGLYYCPGIEISEENAFYSDNPNVDYRHYIECGYLQMILDGGIVYLLLFLLILVPAFIKGMFFSRNLFTKGCAALVLLWLIDMVPFGLPTFNFRYLLVWICVGICYSKELRLKSDSEVLELLDNKSEHNTV